MTMYFICETCKQKYSRQTYTATSAKQSKEYWRERADTEFGLCSDCYKKEQEEKRQQAMEEAGLPEITGSEKQIAWAEKIRFEKYESLQPLPKMTPKGIEAYDRLFSTTEAKFWIDNRNCIARELIVKMASMAPADVEAEIKAEEEKESKAKMQILQPENPIDETPVEIKVTETAVTVNSKKNEKIIDTCKDAGYKWIDGAWRKTIGFKTGIAIDRAADIGNKLLSMGYPVAIDDAEAATKAVSADFEPECTRWVSVNAKSIKKEELCINWKERNDRLYSTAKSLPKAKYVSPDVEVPIKYFHEVEDFAGLYGFKFSPGAQKAISEYKAIIEVKLVTPAKAKDPEKPKGLKGIMDDTKVIEDLKDD